MLPLFAMFKKDSKKAVWALYETGYEKYRVLPRFVVDYLGKEDAKAKTFPDDISKEELAQYLNNPSKAGK